MPKPPVRKPTSGRHPGDNIAGDRLDIQCQKRGKWKLFGKSGQHKGSQTTAEKDARATIVKSYTNVGSSA